MFSNPPVWRRACAVLAAFLVLMQFFPSPVLPGTAQGEFKVYLPSTMHESKNTIHVAGAPTATPTVQPTGDATLIPTGTSQPGSTATPVSTLTGTLTAVPTDPSTATVTPTVTFTATSLPSDTPTATATQTDTPTATQTASPTPTQTPIPVNGNSFYVSPNGSPSGNGSINSPWDITTALNNPSAVHAGDTIWLRGGRYGTGYGTRYTSNLYGQNGKPITLREYPGERAIIDGGILAKGAYTWFWGFEITNSNTERVGTDAVRPPGLYMQGLGHKAINLVVYNTGHPGIGFWTEVGDGGEVYGCIIFGVGTFDTTKITWTDGRGSAIYAQNQTGTHLIADVISFRNLTTGMKAYAENGYVNGFTFEGNVAFETGDRLLFAAGGVNPVTNLKMINNYTYRAPDNSFSPVRLGYADSDQNNAIVQGNWFVDGTHPDGALWVKRFQSLNVTGNTFISPGMEATWIPAVAANNVTWDNNRYFWGNSAPFRVDTTTYSFSGWKSRTGFDAHSAATSSRPTGVNAFVRPNKYDPNRANLIVYNWDHTNAVNLDLSSYLQPGQRYQILDAQNFFGSPVVSGTYNGGSVSVPMNLTAVAPITGQMPFTNTHTSTEFGVYIIFKLP